MRKFVVCKGCWNGRWYVYSSNAIVALASFKTFLDLQDWLNYPAHRRCYL